MNAADWQQVDEYFQVAVELGGEDRSAFLNEACAANLALRREVESLLTADSFEWKLIDGPAMESAAVFFEAEELRLRSGQDLGHYEILRLVGKGGMGEVYLARDRILNRQVALKLLPFDHTSDWGRLQRFRREAESVSALNHPNILTIYELGDAEGQQFIATEFVEGETLRSRIEGGKLQLPDALDIAIQTAKALAAAHRAGIVHRDIKPENIMLRPDGLVKVLDFGLAKLAEQSEETTEGPDGDRVDVSSGLLLGTVRYMSPEQVSGNTADLRSDLFSLGTVLYEMLSGRPAFSEKDPFRITESILKEDPQPLPAEVKEISGLAEIIGKTIEKDPLLRYQNSEELIADLTPLKEAAIVIRGSTRSSRRASVSRFAVGSILSIVLVLVIGSVSYRLLRADPQVPIVKNSSATRGVWTQKAPISEPRWQASPAVANDTLYVVGGWLECKPFGNVQAYDPATNTWKDRSLMLTPRGGHGTAVVEEKIYAVGGNTDCGTAIRDVEAYDPASDSWTRKSPLPSKRTAHTVAAANNKIYAIGGEATTRGGTLRSNTEYDPRSDSWRERAPMPTARQGAATAVVNGIIYVLGGRDETSTQASVEAYDPTTDTWTSRRPMMAPRMQLAAAVVGGTIYVFGGTPFRLEVEAYDTATDSWSIVGSMPDRRTWSSAATLGQTIYLPGGYDGVNTIADVIAFTPETDRVAAVPACPTLQEAVWAELPTARKNMTVGEINGNIYAVGGYDSKTGFRSVNEAYNPATDTWKKRAPMPTARETRATNNAVVDGKLYVIGGNAGGHCSDRNEMYDPAKDIWSAKAQMPTPRCHLAVVAHNGLIFAIGGTNTSGSIKYSALEIYDPVQDVWTIAPPMPTGRQDLGAVAIDDVIYAVGGGNPAFSLDGELDTLEAYDPLTMTWSTRSPMVSRRIGFSAGVLNGMLVVVGGSSENAIETAEAYDPMNNRWEPLKLMRKPRTFLSSVVLDNTLY
ncbi:MAG: kelch repeat-containing protein, partial [Pyrinomonadaceae bacterium]